MKRPNNVYDINDVWCPGCDQPLAKRNKGCQFCGWKDPLLPSGRVQPMRFYFSVMAGQMNNVSSAFICRAYIAGVEDGKKRAAANAILNAPKPKPTKGTTHAAR